MWNFILFSCEIFQRSVKQLYIKYFLNLIFISYRLEIRDKKEKLLVREFILIF